MKEFVHSRETRSAMFKRDAENMDPEPVKVLSVGTTVMGNAIYHENLCNNLASSTKLEVVRRSVSDYWNLLGRILFATVASPRLDPRTHRYRSEWVVSHVVARGIAREVAKAKPDVIHCHTQAHALGCHQLAKSIPLVASMDATARLIQRLPGYESQGPALTKIAAMESRLFSSCAATGGVTSWVVESLCRDYKIPAGRVCLCSPSVDTALFRPAFIPITSAGKVNVTFVGNDLERKGGHLLLDLMKGGLSDCCTLHVVSGATPPDSLPPGVTWHGGVKPRSAELIGLLQQADIFALPTREECYSEALLEAMACGLPLVSTNVMGVPDLVQHGINGFCLVPGDKIALGRSLMELVQSAALRGKFGAASREIAESRFSFSATRGSWETIFLRAAGH